jgi:hypothetical protein
VKNARFSFAAVYLDADGDPLDPTTPDSEISKDNGAFADCAEEVTTASGSNGAGLLTLTGAETDVSMAVVCLKVASGPKATLITLYPRVLATVGSGTLSAGSAGGGTLGTLLAYDVTGCFLRTTGGTGGGGTGGANNQARRIVTYNTGTGAFTVSPNWETTPSTDTTYDVLLPEGVTLGMLKTLNPTTAGRTADVAATGEIGLDFDNIHDATGAHTLTNITVPTVTTVTNQLTAAVVAAAVWDLATSGHTTSGTFGAAMNAAGSAGDPWATALPGAYGAGTAGHIVGTGIPDIAPGSANGLLRGGTNTATTFATLTVTGAVAFQSTFVVTGATTLTGAVTATNAGNNVSGIDVKKIEGADATDTIDARIAADLAAYGASTFNPATTDVSVDNVQPGALGDIGTAVAAAMAASPVGSVAAGGITRASFAADTGLQTVRSGTAQAGAAGSITLDSGASATTNAYQWLWVRTTGGTGAGQVRLVTAYNGTTKVATVARSWVTNPDATTTFAILDAAGVDVEAWGGAVPNALISGNVPANTQATAATLTFTLVGDLQGSVIQDVAGTVHGDVLGTLHGDVQGKLLGGGSSTIGGVGAQVGAVASVTAGVTVATNNDKTGYALAAAGLDPVLIESAIAASAALVNDAGTQLTAVNARQALAAILSAVAAQLAGAATTTVTTKPAAKPAANDRITATVTADGDRTAVTLRVPT